MKRNFKKNKGYTLLELILYISISSVMLFVISMTLSMFFEARIKNQTITEVDGDGIHAMTIITQIIRNADSVNSPMLGSNSNVLSVNVSDPFKNPTVFELSGGEITIKEGLNVAVPLTNSLKSNVSDLLFENLSRPASPDSISISFKNSHINNSGRNEYDFSRSFYGSASLRN